MTDLRTKRTNRYSRSHLRWFGNDLKLGRKVLVSIVPDEKYPGMWRVCLPDGKFTDMVNLSRAKDAAVSHALAILD